MDYEAMYDGIMDLQSELRYELQSYTLLSEVDYRLVKALAASYELQDYLANKLAEEPDQAGGTRITEETMERYYHTTRLRAGAPKSREVGEKKRLTDFLEERKNCGCHEGI